MIEYLKKMSKSLKQIHENTNKKKWRKLKKPFKKARKTQTIGESQ